MVLVRDSVLLAALTLALALFLCGAPLPLYSVRLRTSNASARLSVSFFEKCPLDSANDDRVIASECTYLTHERADCETRRPVDTLGKIAVVGALVFTTLTIALMSVVDHLGEYSATGRFAGTVLACGAALFGNLWWIMCVAAWSAPLCSSAVASDPDSTLGPSVALGAAGALLVSSAAIVAAFPSCGLDYTI
jgi:hypothetical protein